MSIATIRSMNVIVLGAGAIGTLYGARLSTANDVTLVARKEHVDRIRAEGVRITGLEDATYRVNASTEIRALAAHHSGCGQHEILRALHAGDR